VGRDRTLDQGDPRIGVGIGHHAQAGGVTTPPGLTTKNAWVPRVFLCV
jgi:hypothetical protein